MKKNNKKGFFLSETMVVIAVVSVVLLGVFKLFNSVYYRFRETENYNTQNAINALSNIQKYYENIDDIDVDVFNDDTTYIDLTNSEKYESDYYTSLKETLNVKSVYMIDLNKYFNDTTSSQFNVSLKRYINSLRNVNGIVLVAILNNNEYAHVQLVNYVDIKLNGNEEDEYAVYIPVGGKFVDPGYTGWHGDEPEITWENNKEIDTDIEGNYYLHYNFNGYVIRRKVVVGNKNAGAYITTLLSEEEELHNGLVQTYATVNGKEVDAGIRYVGSVDEVKNKVYFNCTEPDGKNTYGTGNYSYGNNCEIWRIIGVFDTKSSEVKTEKPVKRIKIVREEALSKRIEWDFSEIEGQATVINQWGETTLKSDNTTPYFGSKVKRYLNDGDLSYYNSLTPIAQEQISEALWYTGAVSADTASGIYEEERSNIKSEESLVNYTTTWVGKIGLIYLSDYAYASTDESCTNHIFGSNSTCKNSNWLVSSNFKDYWSITSDKDCDVCVAHISQSAVNFIEANMFTFYVYPSLYLASDVEIIGGDGDENPYILK